MTWELGYFYGLASGGVAVGLIGLFVHAGYWERWTRQMATMKDDLRDANADWVVINDERDAAARSEMTAKVRADQFARLCDRLTAERDEARGILARSVSQVEVLAADLTNAMNERDDAIRQMNHWKVRADDAETSATLHRDERDEARADLTTCDMYLAKARGERDEAGKERETALVAAEASDERCRQAEMGRAHICEQVARIADACCVPRGAS